MFIEKYLLSLFTIICVYFTCYCDSRVNQEYENNILEFSSPGIESLIPIGEEDSMLSLNNYTDWSADIKECKCKNGRCEKICAQWMNGACLKMKQTCVCDPEFGLYDDETCVYCDCKKGISCTFDRKTRGNLRKCTCPEDYYQSNLECWPLCSESRPCLNGGTCYNGKCRCLERAYGVLCDYIYRCSFECRARLTVDCIYNQKTNDYGCQCKNRSLVFDYEENLCKPCPCGEGTCKEERHELKCDCKAGYKEFKKQCKKCDCGLGFDCDFHYRTGEKICKCRKGFVMREGTCLPCECGHEDATCSLDNVGRKVCTCPEGYEDKLGLCEKKGENCTCHPTAKCIKTDDGFTCACEDGYMAQYHNEPEPGEPCIDFDECVYTYACPRSNFQRCINLPGSFMCQCITGFRPDGEADESGKITCKEYKVSWLPTYITIGVLIGLVALSVGSCILLNYRNSSRSSPGIEMRRSR